MALPKFETCIRQSTVSNGDIDQQVSLDTLDPVQHGQTHRGSGCDHEIAPGVLSPDQNHPDRSTANSPEFLTHESTSTQVPGKLHRAPTTIIRNQVFIDLTLVDDDPSTHDIFNQDGKETHQHRDFHIYQSKGFITTEENEASPRDGCSQKHNSDRLA
ncbi:hypothetical protein BKA56DRAFT_611069 [Ilyonectria sp. MPI-CAGE-AT-0026]|nr:hypothetical protein BKA56DRAFT_611069 [Ilyonectria sp. MPI-CAGE-AT-0026]